jgi:hypothetical protein
MYLSILQYKHHTITLIFSVFFWGKFLQPANKKKRVGESNKGIFEIKKKKSPYLNKEKT